MGLLSEIQAGLVEDTSPIGSILLKLRLLAGRLKSAPLADWVKYESEGYPDDAELPNYRQVGVVYRATFSGPFGSGINNAPIPPYLIKQFAGEDWNTREIRQSAASIDELIAGSEGGTITISGGNLPLLLQGKAYPDFSCVAASGLISTASLKELQHAVRTRILELTIELENTLPGVGEVSVSNAGPQDLIKQSDAVAQITHQVVYGNVTSISNSGAGSQFNLQIGVGDASSVVKRLHEAGIPESDAKEFAALLGEETPESKAEPFGPKTKKWLVKSLAKAGSGIWNVGVSVASKVMTEAALKYYGLGNSG